MDKPEVDLSKFKRKSGLALMAVPAALGVYGRYTLQADLHTIAQLGYGMDARAIPTPVLQLMASHASVYQASRIISGIVRRPDLFSVRHSNPKIKAETEAWLWPILPRLLAAAAHAFEYGTVAVVLEWERKTLRFTVPSSNGKERKRTAERHTHFGKAFEIDPAETTLELDEQGEILRVQTLADTYGRDRVHVWVWDPEFDSVVGQSARRRAWRPYCEHLILTLLRDKYLERSVDAPRVAYVPEGEIEVDGVTKTVAEHVGDLLDDLRGSGSVELPSVRDSNGNRKYDLDVLDVPDRADVWDQALNRAEAEIFLAYLVSSTLSGGLDEAGGAASRTLEGMLREHIEDFATWIAEGLTRIVGLVHRANYDADEVEEPEVCATDVGKQSARKILREVLTLVNNAGRGEVALHTDVPALLDRLGVPLRVAPPEFPDGWGGEASEAADVGRPREPDGSREQRREDAATEGGEDDTGAPRDEDGEQAQANAGGDVGATSEDPQ